MFSQTWRTSERRHTVRVQRGVTIPAADGTELCADIFRPEGDGRFPALFAFHPYDQTPQTAPIKAQALSTAHAAAGGHERGNAWIEAGDPYFFARRGYAYVLGNVRGTGRSGGVYPFLAPPEAQDGCDAIEWIARQPWCDGQVGMFGVSYFAWIQFFIAALNPPSLKCLFAPWGATDLYRDAVYHGGILGHGFWRMWARGSLHRGRVESQMRKALGERAFAEAVGRVLQDDEIAAVPELVEILRSPEAGVNPLLVDLLLNPLDGPYWEARRVAYERIRVPAYLGADWGMYGLHLPAAFRSWEGLAGPKKLLIGPPAYLDRPVSQLQYEALRWFDHWLKGIETGFLREPPIKLFLMGSHAWREADRWPLPETRWTPFYLHEDRLLWERDPWPDEPFDVFEDSPWQRGGLTYVSPRLVEETEVIGPIVLNLFASSTEPEVLWFVSLREVDEGGNERVLTRGWLRGTHREVDADRSRPWHPVHPHTRAQPLTPGAVTAFAIALVPTGVVFKAGSRIALKIGCADDVPAHPLEMIAAGHLRRPSASRVAVYHDAARPSHLLLPITRGNVVGTFVSGGRPYL